MRLSRLSATLLISLGLGACGKPQVINLGRKADGTPRSQIWLDHTAKREVMAERAQTAAANAPVAVGMPIAGPPPEVLEGPVTVGLRRDGASVVAGKSVRPEEIASRLAYVRESRTKAGSADVTTMTVQAEAQVPMDRVMDAMSAASQAGFTKIGWQLVAAVALPAPVAVEAALPSDEGRLVVSVGANGALRLGGTALEAAALGAKLGEAAGQRKAQGLQPPAVTLLADRGAPPAAVREVLGACEAAGITSVALGTPVPVASTTPAANVVAGQTDISEAYRNWRLGLEDRSVDFSEGPPAYWYDALFHAFLDEHDMTLDALNPRVLNSERIKVYGAKGAGRLEQMGGLLALVDAPRGEALKGLGADYRRETADAAAGRANFELTRLHVQELHDRVVKAFPPASVAFPADLKVPPPQKKETAP